MMRKKSVYQAGKKGMTALLTLALLLAGPAGVAQVQVQQPEAPARLLDDLKSSDPALRRRSINQIGEMRARNALRPLTAALSDPEAIVREAAAFALGMIADPAAGGPLIRSMGDTDPEVRASAAFALGMLNERKATATRSQALGDEYVAVRAAAVTAFGLMQDAEAVDEIAAMLNDTSYDVRYDAAWALGMIGEPDALDHLRGALAGVNALKVDRSLREALRQALQSSIEMLEFEAGPGRARRANPPQIDLEAKPVRSIKVRQAVRPAPTERATRARVGGTVKVKTIVSVYGRAVRAYVTRRLGYGLDQRAIQAVMQYRFDPAMESGMPQATWVELEVKF